MVAERHQEGMHLDVIVIDGLSLRKINPVGVGWGEVINGGFGMLLDGSEAAEHKLKTMLFYDVNNGIARRSWARNEEAVFAIKKAMEKNEKLQVTLPHLVSNEILDKLT